MKLQQIYRNKKLNSL